MLMPGKKTILLSLAALAALLIAGCGGGGGDETETTTTPTVEEPAALTKDELITEGDGVCAEVNAAVGALSSSETESSSSENSEKVANLYTGMVERLQDLGPPEGEEAEYEKFSEATEELGQVEADLKLAAEREDEAALEEKGQEAAAALEEFQTQAAAYGFEKCGEEPGLPTTAGGETPAGEEFEGGEEEGGVEVEPEFEEPAPEEEIVPEEEVAPETGGAGGSPEAPEPAPETGGESGGVGPG
jgi:hypothetical protein